MREGRFTIDSRTKYSKLLVLILQNPTVVIDMLLRVCTVKSK